jgi:hypothetical protein
MATGTHTNAQYKVLKVVCANRMTIIKPQYNSPISHHTHCIHQSLGTGTSYVMSREIPSSPLATIHWCLWQQKCFTKNYNQVQLSAVSTSRTANSFTSLPVKILYSNTSASTNKTYSDKKHLQHLRMWVGLLTWDQWCKMVTCQIQTVRWIC